MNINLHGKISMRVSSLLVVSFLVLNMSKVTADATTTNQDLSGKKIELFDLDHKPIANHSLCKSDEIVVFSCRTKRAKTVSLCAQQGFAKGVGMIKYRYGKDSKSVELEYPKGNKPAIDSFKQYSEFPELGYSKAMSFHVESYRYSIFLTQAHDYEAHDDSLAGVVIDSKGSLVAFNECILRSVATSEHVFRNGLGDFGQLGLKDAGDDISFASVAAIEMDGDTGVNAIGIGEGN